MKSRSHVTLLMLVSTVFWTDYARASVVLSLGGSSKAAGGSPWTLRNANASISVPSTVPGVVHLDLLRADRIGEPYYRYGELEQAWIYLEPSWTYTHTHAPFRRTHWARPPGACCSDRRVSTRLRR